MPAAKQSPAPPQVAPVPAPAVPLKSGQYAAVRRAAIDPGIPITWTASNRIVCDTVHLTCASGETGEVHLVDGDVAWVETELVKTTFVERLVESGLVSQAELELTYALCRVENLNLVQGLTRLGLIDKTQLRVALRDYVFEALGALLAGDDPPRSSWTQSPLAFEDSLTITLGELLDPDKRTMFRQLLVQAGGAPARTHDDTRIPLRRTATVDTVNGTMMMTTIDFSMSGARLRAQTLLPIASRVLVHINIAGESLSLPGRVVRFDRATDKDMPALVVLWTEMTPQTESLLSRVWSSLY